MGGMRFGRSVRIGLVLAVIGALVPITAAVAANPHKFAAFTVQAIDVPTSTGLTVAAGEILTFDAFGTWCMGGTPPNAECGSPSGHLPPLPHLAEPPATR